MVSKLSDPHHLTVAKAAFQSVFRCPDPFNEPFQPRLTERLILYPISYEFEEHEYAAVAAAAGSLGESTAFITLTEISEGQEVLFEDLEHWQIDLGYYPYEALLKQEWSPIMENAIYSTQGSWGLVISHEQHAVVGGPPRFIEALKANLPGGESQVHEFLDTWKDNRDRLGYQIDWLQRLLAHVYGADRAQRLLVEADLL